MSDDIDDLVDWQLNGSPSGEFDAYRQERCWRCSRHKPAEGPCQNCDVCADCGTRLMITTRCQLAISDTELLYLCPTDYQNRTNDD